jgi:hypothetical protein
MEPNEITIETFRNNHDMFFDFLDFFLDFKPKEYQKKFLLDCLHSPRIAGVWCRQSGKTTCVGVYSLFRASIEKVDIKIVAPALHQSGELFSKMKSMVEGNTKMLPNIKRMTMTELEWNNKSKIKVLTAGVGGKSARGYTADILIIEESQHHEDEAVNAGIMPLVASKPNAQVIKIGTPLKKDHFYRSCYNPDTEYKVSRVTWEDAIKEGQYTLKFIEEQKNNLTDVEFELEYNANFIDDTLSFFPMKLVQGCAMEYALKKNI